MACHGPELLHPEWRGFLLARRRISGRCPSEERRHHTTSSRRLYRLGLRRRRLDNRLRLDLALLVAHPLGLACRMITLLSNLTKRSLCRQLGRPSRRNKWTGLRLDFLINLLHIVVRLQNLAEKPARPLRPEDRTHQRHEPQIRLLPHDRPLKQSDQRTQQQGLYNNPQTT